MQYPQKPPVARLDFEGYSEAGLIFNFKAHGWKTANVETGGQKKSIGLVGGHAYAAHPSTEVLVACYQLPGGPVETWRPGDPPPQALFDHVAAGGLVAAWNSFFEWSIWNLVCCRRYGWPELPLHQTQDSMAQALMWGLPGSLEQATAAFWGQTTKDARGKDLIAKLCGPRNPTKADGRLRRLRSDLDSTELWTDLDAYCKQDVVAEGGLSEQLPPLSEWERRVWLVDQAINARGVLIDAPLVEACLKIMATAKSRAGAELTRITGGAVNGVSEATAMLAWVNARTPYPLDDLRNENLDEYLDEYGELLPPEVLEVLTIRSETAGSAPAKLVAMKYHRSPDGRARGLLQYSGAQRTRRWAGRAIQTQNMPNGGPACEICPKCDVPPQPAGLGGGKYCQHVEVVPYEWGQAGIEAVIPDLLTGDFDRVAARWGNPAKAVAGCLRSMLIAAPGKEFLCADFSAIEAVVLACIAGESWIVEVFQTHGKFYETAASMATGVPLAEILAYKKETGLHHPTRKIGKVRTLAGGFQGGLGAWLKFGAGKFMTRIEIKADVKDWRAKSPSIVHIWYASEDAAKDALRNPGVTVPVLRRDGSHSGISYLKQGRALYCLLPSGGHLTYVDAALEVGTKLSSLGWDWINYLEQMEGKRLPDQFAEVWEAEGRKLTRKVRAVVEAVCNDPVEKITYWGPGKKPKGAKAGTYLKGHDWIKQDTYGGKLTENWTQATARDIQAWALVNLEEQGFPVVLHTHDEAVVEVEAGSHSPEEVERVMSNLPPWAVLPDGSPWPVKAAGGWRWNRFKK